MRLREFVITFGIVAALSAPATAAEHTETLRTALSHIPETAIAGKDPIPISFLDVKAMAKAEGGALSDGALRRLMLVQPIRPLESLNFGGGKTWTEKAGIAFEDISYFAGFGQPPAMLSYWGFSDTSAVDGLRDTLRKRKFAAVPGFPDVLANGEPRAINLLTREPDNPWVGPLGQSTFVMPLYRTLVQASSPEDFLEITKAKRSVAVNPAIAIALDGLDGAALMKDGSILQAMVITPLVGLETMDPAALVLANPGNFEAIEKDIEAKMEKGRQGIPAYLGGVLADVQLPHGPALVVSLSYSDCPTAELAVLKLQARWKEGIDTAGTINASGEAVHSFYDDCAAVVSFSDSTPGAARNLALSGALGRYMNRDFNVLQIGN